ncbi:hypothetical protein IFT72_13580 [Frigoribacterium sp. CFBP 8754]|uniref:hypothetical protein n=1 Tax=unclassified Frigoribacterium TaxID=2627005 RepID=UPI0006FC0687|nr:MULTISPECIES: hypothetical protein [unclassified Frigoribacterium]KQR44322.1 hypothetical protein ASF82_12680 [Frigoribacterium sp. Leaf164]MBD8661214.1 hypothetical protein [Frigoribacterium sp. CFBP 8754]MBD8729084.1 hypothetical protein [Frigoribacterium sp. CFBP 13707]QNE43736.1 hypothetical protein F1C15_07920 [Frigoribacterium sp. NBH87]
MAGPTRSRLARRAQAATARVLGFLSAIAAVVGLVSLAKGSVGVGVVLLFAAFVLVAVAWAIVRAAVRRAADGRATTRR